MSSIRPERLADTRLTGLRAGLNWVNLTTPLGLLVARLGSATVAPLGRGTYLATGYRLGVPSATAFTIGSIVVSKRGPDYFARRPALLRHEDRHCTQYACVLGIAMLPVYGICAAVSYAIAGDHASYNPFERLAGLADGNYAPPRPRLTRR